MIQYIKQETASILTVEIVLTATSDQVIKYLRWEKRFLQFSEVQLQHSGYWIYVLAIHLVWKWIFACNTHSRTSTVGKVQYKTMDFQKQLPITMSAKAEAYYNYYLHYYYHTIFMVMWNLQ